MVSVATVAAAVNTVTLRDRLAAGPSSRKSESCLQLTRFLGGAGRDGGAAGGRVVLMIYVTRMLFCFYILLLCFLPIRVSGHLSTIVTTTLRNRAFVINV